MTSDEMSCDITALLKQDFENLVTPANGGSIHFVCMDWRHMPEIEQFE
jgi:hypothetical protein